jgi:NADH dehydrogenase
MGVEVLTNARVVDVGPDGVKLEHGTISSGTVLWAAGADASPLGRTLGVPVNASGRVPVEPDLSLAGHPEVSVIGDLAFVADANGRPLTAVAPVAIQQGRAVAENIWRSILGRPPRAFRYRDRRPSAESARSISSGVRHGSPGSSSTSCRLSGSGTGCRSSSVGCGRIWPGNAEFGSSRAAGDR